MQLSKKPQLQTHLASVTVAKGAQVEMLILLPNNSQRQQHLAQVGSLPYRRPDNHPILTKSGVDW